MATNQLRSHYRRKNLFIYLKNGRWIAVIIMLAMTLMMIELLLVGYGYLEIDNSRLGLILPVSIFSFIDILGLILFLVPVYFKNNQFKKFWIRLIILYLCCSLGDLMMIKLLQNIGLFNTIDVSLVYEMMICLFNQLNVLLGFTGILYFFELSEEINMTKEIKKNLTVINESVRRMHGTKTDLPYLMQSLRGIRSKLADQELGLNVEREAGDAILLFADILRYKLYGYDQQKVPLNEELNTVSNLVDFYNSVISHRDNYCDVECVGDSLNMVIVKQQLVKIVYPFLNNSESPLFRHLLIYIELQDEQLEMTIQCESSSKVYVDQALSKIKEEVPTTIDNINFDYDSETHQFTLNVCLKIQKELTALS